MPWAEAFALERGVLPRALEAWRPQHVYVGAVLRALGRILAQRGLDDEARASLLEAKRILTGELG